MFERRNSMNQLPTGGFNGTPFSGETEGASSEEKAESSEDDEHPCSLEKLAEQEILSGIVEIAKEATKEGLSLANNRVLMIEALGARVYLRYYVPNEVNKGAHKALSMVQDNRVVGVEVNLAGKGLDKYSSKENANEDNGEPDDRVYYTVEETSGDSDESELRLKKYTYHTEGSAGGSELTVPEAYSMLTFLGAATSPEEPKELKPFWEEG